MPKRANKRPVGIVKRKITQMHQRSVMPKEIKRRSRGQSFATQYNSSNKYTPSSSLHRHAASAVARVLKADETGNYKGASIKTLTLSASVPPQLRKATYAVTVETLKYLPILRKLIERNQAIQSQLMLETAFVLVRDLLFGEGLRPEGPAEQAVISQKNNLSWNLKVILQELGIERVEEALPACAAQTEAASRPRAVRINTLKISMEHALKALEQFSPTLDVHLSDVLLLPPGTDLHAHPLVMSGKIVLQSKASCMSAIALSPEEGWTVLDACAAPGNKTTHLASLVGKKGRVLAFDKDPRRYRKLVESSKRAGAEHIIETCCADFLTLDPLEYSHVKGLLLDPSCSGSGTRASRMDHLLPSASGGGPQGQEAMDYVDDRVEALAAFQETALRHAFKFPAVERIVYSTCSLYTRENEQVIENVLCDAKAAGLQLVKALPQWARREVTQSDGAFDATLVVRTDTLEDKTDGFFVALFERRKEHSLL